jgi:preprotein translocase subunit SecE
MQFVNDELKEFDVSPFLDKGIFSELKDIGYFNKVRVTLGAVEWPNEQDFSKDTLYILGTAVST